MAAPSKDYRYSIEFNIHALDAPGTRLIKTGDIYINICLLGMHKRTRLMPPYLPMHIDQKLYFDKVFKFCYDTHDVIDRLAREHVLIEFIQNDLPTPILLASYETTAREFLYPYSADRVSYTGLRRYVLLTRTIDFPGISPSLEFSTSPSIDDVTGLSLMSTGNRRLTRTAKQSKSATWKATPSSANRSRLNNSMNISRSITSHTISSAVKNDYGQRETQEKLRELAVDRDINYITPVDKTKGRPPFVVRRVDQNLINRQPKSHDVLNDGLMINDYTLSRPESVASLYTNDVDLNRSRSISPVVGRSLALTSGRVRSPKLSQSMDFERHSRSQSPERYLSSDNLVNDEYYSRSPSRYDMSPTLHRDSFRYRYRYSPAADLSDKVIRTLRRNLDSYSPSPWHRYYSSYRYADGHYDTDIDNE